MILILIPIFILFHLLSLWELELIHYLLVVAIGIYLLIPHHLMLLILGIVLSIIMRLVVLIVIVQWLLRLMLYKLIFDLALVLLDFGFLAISPAATLFLFVINKGCSIAGFIVVVITGSIICI